MIESAIELVGSGQTPPPEAMPPARYTLDGALERARDGRVAELPGRRLRNLALVVCRACRGGGRLTEGAAAAVRLVARYLRASWRLKCFNCWEEFDGGEHASTRAAVVAGLVAAASLLDDGEFAAEADRVRADLFEGFVADGRFARARGDARLDGSLLWLAIPFGVLAARRSADRRDRRSRPARADRPRGRRLSLPRRHVLRRWRMAASDLVACLARRARRQARRLERARRRGCARRPARAATCPSR